MPLRRRDIAICGGTMAVGLLLSSCTPSSPPSTSPTPVVVPTSSKPTPTEEPREREERLAFEGAEKAYRTFINEYLRVTAKTRKPELTAKMRQNAGGPYLSAYKGFLKAQRELEVKSSGPSVITVERVGYATDRVLLTACEDGSKIKIVDRDGKTFKRGSAGTIELTVRLIDSHWVVWDGDNEKTVKSCTK